MSAGEEATAGKARAWYIAANANELKTNEHVDARAVNSSLHRSASVVGKETLSRRPNAGPGSARRGDSLLSTAAGCLEKSFRARAHEVQCARYRVRDFNERHALASARTSARYDLWRDYIMRLLRRCISIRDGLISRAARR